MQIFQIMHTSALGMRVILTFNLNLALIGAILRFILFFHSTHLLMGSISLSLANWVGSYLLMGCILFSLASWVGYLTSVECYSEVMSLNHRLATYFCRSYFLPSADSRRAVVVSYRHKYKCTQYKDMTIQLLKAKVKLQIKQNPNFLFAFCF